MSSLPQQQGMRALQAAQQIAALWRKQSGDTPVDRLVTGGLREKRSLGSQERRDAAELVFAYVRCMRKVQAMLQTLQMADTAENGIALIAEQQGLHTGLFTPAAVAEAEQALPTPQTPLEYIAVTLSFPDELARELLAIFPPQEAIQAAEALNQRAPTTLRIHPQRTTRNTILKAIPEAVPASYSPWGVHLYHRVNIYDLPGFRKGWFEVQEEASQLVALLANPSPGQTVVDVGAGAGGKTLALAALMENQGRLIALDNSAKRLQEMQRRAAHAGVTCTEQLALESSHDGWWLPARAAQRTLSRLQAKAHCVLVDAPCTGSGVLRRRPDARWRLGSVEACAGIQYNLLQQSAQLTAPGGILVYATCAIERAQNEEVAERFLNSDFGRCFTAVSPAERLREAAEKAARMGAKAEQNTSTPWETVAECDFFRTWPHKNGMDAFFAVCMKRNM